MNDVNMSDVLTRWLTGRLETVHTMIPATVQSYEGHKTRRAVVVPSVHWRSTSGAVVPYSPVAGVPVVFPSTSRFSMVFDLKQGDTGMLLVAESAMGNWLGGDGKAQEAEDASRFTLNDAIFIPGLFPYATVPAIDAPNDGAYMAYEGTSIEFKASGGLKIKGNLEVEGDTAITGKVTASAEITAKFGTTPVNLSTHLHPTPAGPSSAPTPGT